MKRILIPLLLLSLGCPSSPEDTNGSRDMNTMSDMGATDTSSDSGTDMMEDMDVKDVTDDAGEDMSGPKACVWPEAQIAGTPETDALANAAARCGQEPYAWLKSGPLGEIVEYGESRRIPATTLRLAIASQGVDPPPEIRYNAKIETFSYKTQDRGELINATAMVGWPQKAEEIKGVMLLLHGTTGFTDSCAPSHGTESQALVALFTSFGYLVVAPDYIGLKSLGEPSPELHPYLSGQATAIASLDALRAVHQMDPEKRGGHCPPTETLIFGGSQGGHAALWVDRLAPYYAREISLLGTVATVPPMDTVGQITRALQEKVNATANSLAFFSTSADWYGADITDVLEEPYATDIPAALRMECGPKLQGDPTLEQVFTPEVLEAAKSREAFAAFSPWGCMTAENSLLDTSIARINEDAPSYGVMIVTGETDNLVHTPLERAAFPGVCEHVPSRYLECAGAGHGPATFYSVPEIMEFFDARLAGEPFTKDCVAHAPTRCSLTPD